MVINQSRRSPASSRQRLGAGLVAIAMTAVGLPLAAVSASALLDPNVGPAAPHSIIVFPARDFVHLDGYAATDVLTMNVLRDGFVVGTTLPFSPDQPDPKNPGSFMADINHVGPPCWSSVTPDIRAGDVVQVLTSPTTGDQTPTAGVTVTQAATKVDPSTVVTRGSAVAAGGGQIPIDQLEARIVANKQAFVASGARTLRASATGPIAGKFEGNLAYDSPTSTTWTATFTGLGGVSAVDGLSDADRAVASESRGQWLGRNPLAVSENTIYEYGPFPGTLVFPGPAIGCTAPFASGPSVHMTAGTDTGASSADAVTSNPSPTFAGVASQLTATNVNLYVDGVLSGTQAVAAGGSYSLTPATSLTDGPHTVTAGEMAPSIADPTISVETMGNAPLSITIDSGAPAAPVVATPASPGISSTLSVKGTSEFGSTVGLFTNAACSAPAAGSVSAVDFAAAGVSVSVPVGSTTDFFATATDLAGNVSACSTGAASYVQDSVSPIVTTITPAANATGVSQIANVTAKFSENVTGVGGTTFTLRSAGSLVAATVGYTNVGGATLDPTTTLAPATVYTAALTSALKDAAGNPIPATSWSFTTGPRPTVTTHTPAANATKVSQAGNITATFSENVSQVSGTTFMLKTSAGTAVAAVVSYNATTRVATLNPTATLAPATTYAATLTATIKDADGNPITATSWNFATGPRPTVTTKSPVANAAGVPQIANMTATFSEGVTGVSPTAFTLKKTTTGTAIAAVASYNALTHVATLNPTATLAAATTYTATLTGSIRDADGNPITATTWSFTTGPRPTVTRISPASNALGISRVANVGATFSENVSGVSRTTFTLKKTTTGALVTVTVSYNATTHVATLNPSVTLAAFTTYTVTLTSGIKDADGNPITAKSWRFTTGRT